MTPSRAQPDHAGEPPVPSATLSGEFLSYLSATGFSGAAFSMQQLLVSWLLIGVLLLPADRVGLLQAAIGLPGVLLMLWGGASADRSDPRSLLLRSYALAPLLPLALALLAVWRGVEVWSVVLWGLGMSVALAFSSPAQQAILNRVSGKALQRGVTATTSLMFFVQMLGLSVAGQLERIGLAWILGIQASLLLVAAVLIRRVRPVVPNVDGREASPAWRRVAEGLRATWKSPVVKHVLILNFVSSIFNAGAFITVFPFIIKRVYGGDAALLATMMIVFYAGAMVSNLLLMRFMPLVHPGRWFLIMQLSRIFILLLLWIEPSWWLLVIAIVSWGLNMGVTSTLARTIVQESAEPEFRGRILSVYTLGLLGSPPLGAVVLGWIIESFGTLNALIPAMATSVVLFTYGAVLTQLWSYQSPEVVV